MYVLLDPNPESPSVLRLHPQSTVAHRMRSAWHGASFVVPDFTPSPSILPYHLLHVTRSPFLWLWLWIWLFSYQFNNHTRLSGLL